MEKDRYIEVYVVRYMLISAAVELGKEEA